ncbi:hypothetical protein AVEN_114010-1 [Araneus ventricosus]|uniref:Uncharacterized protein n=1 Tax=Araneus ventricosus TaxID=182803 RepID=A0A4Y2SQS9_ARAVE|nr:hypothetical protein AVEN_114010-1 [Araneus ventricosus]
MRYTLYTALNGSLLCRKLDGRRLAAMSRNSFSSISSVESESVRCSNPHQSFRKTFNSIEVAYFRSFDHLIFITFSVIVIDIGFLYLDDDFIISHQLKSCIINITI